ncbi:MAG: ankyrin repeat domain-containing protein [bacterium]
MKKIFKLFLFLQVLLMACLFSRVDYTDYNEFTNAANNGLLESMKSLLNKYKGKEDRLFLVNCQDQKGGTALSRACFKGYCDIVKFLLEKGAEVDKANKYGTTPLSWVTKVEVAKLYHSE